MIKIIILFTLFNLLKLESNMVEISSHGMEQSNAPLFSANISVPQKVRVNEDFTIIADLKVESDLEMSITSGNQMFTYIIQDVNGKKINSYAKVDIGINQTISGRTIISEEYKYKIREPGIYYVSAVAEFSVHGDHNNEIYNIETDRKKIEVDVNNKD